jgi:formate/nitrite transporter FocA (FNT family)
MYIAKRVLETPKQRAVALMIIQLGGVVAVLAAAHFADDKRSNEFFAQILLSCVLGTLVGGYFFASLPKR